MTIATIKPHWEKLVALYSAEQVRELDRRVIQAGTPGIVLMKRAAAAVLSALQSRWPKARQLLVVCGKGNNGGDGLLLAKLALEKGLQVQLLMIGEQLAREQPPDSAPAFLSEAKQKPLPDAEIARQWYAEVGEALYAVEDVAQEAIDVVVDALLGTGLNGRPRDAQAEAIAFIEQLDKPVVAVDIPSGLCSDSGRVLGDQAVTAEATVSFIGLKKGLYTGNAAEHVGDIVFDALVPHLPHTPYASVRLCDMQVLATLLPRRRQSAYKQSSGHVLVIGGDEGMGGAVALSAQAAARCGAGLVSVATRPDHCGWVNAIEPSLMVRGIKVLTLNESGDAGDDTDDSQNGLQQLLAKATVIAIGPGLGRSDWAKSLFTEVLVYLIHRRSMPLVVDADALNLLASEPSLANAWRQWRLDNLETPAVITPHPGEAQRLLDQPPSDRYELVDKLQRRYRATALLKGAGTLITEQDQTLVCPYGNAVLATAGSGDVLTGLVAALLAQGLDGQGAASLAACLHGAAADTYLQNAGPFGLTASDLPQRIASEMNRYMLA